MSIDMDFCVSKEKTTFNSQSFYLYFFHGLIMCNARGARVLVTGASTGIGEQMAYH